PWCVLSALEKFEDAQQNHRADKGDQNAAEVNAVDIPIHTQLAHDKAANERADNADDDVHQAALTVIGLHHQTGEPTRDPRDNNPGNDTHVHLPLMFALILYEIVTEMLRLHTGQMVGFPRLPDASRKIGVKRV